MIPLVSLFQRTALVLLLSLGALASVWGARPPLIRIGLIDQESMVTVGPGDVRVSENPRVNPAGIKKRPPFALLPKGFALRKNSGVRPW
jgi:hypothetical protein